MPKRIEYKKDQELGDQCYYQYDLTDYNKYKGRRAIFKCRCGNEFEASINNIKTKNTKSCGCLDNCTAPVHNGWGTRLYSIWNGMKDRCTNPNNLAYCNYGGKNITFCQEWYFFEPFRDWALANGYSDKLSLDRIDGTKGYFPENCRWASAITQSQNRGKGKNNKTGYKGVSYCKSTGKYKASIGFNNSQKTLGRFTTPEMAAEAYNTFVIVNGLEHTLNEIQQTSRSVKA